MSVRVEFRLVKQSFAKRKYRLGALWSSTLFTHLSSIQRRELRKHARARKVSFINRPTYLSRRKSFPGRTKRNFPTARASVSFFFWKIYACDEYICISLRDLESPIGSLGLHEAKLCYGRTRIPFPWISRDTLVSLTRAYSALADFALSKSSRSCIKYTISWTSMKAMGEPRGYNSCAGERNFESDCSNKGACRVIPNAKRPWNNTISRSRANAHNYREIYAN